MSASSASTEEPRTLEWAVSKSLMNDRQMLCLRIAALTHVGLRRTRNEDCVAVGARCANEPLGDPWVALHPLDQPCVCLVADGLGGHPAGDVASRLAVEHLYRDLAGLAPSDEAIVAALHEANRALFQAMARTPAHYGMGTTLAGIIVHEANVHAFNVGDSRVYRVCGDKLEQISIDDSIPVGSPSPLNRSRQRVLSQCLGGFVDFDPIRPHVTQLRAQAGDGYVICSDGLHDMLSDREIAACLQADVADSIQALFEKAMDEGGVDNISIIYARIEDAQPTTASQ